MRLHVSALRAPERVPVTVSNLGQDPNLRPSGYERDSRPRSIVAQAPIWSVPAGCAGSLKREFQNKLCPNCAPEALFTTPDSGTKVLISRCFVVSGRQDLNLRPPGPQPGALPDCATPRGLSILRPRRPSRRSGKLGFCCRTALRAGFARGGSSMVEPRPSKAMMRVRSSSPALSTGAPRWAPHPPRR